MPSNAILAREISASETHLTILTHRGKTEIRWEMISERLSQATSVERTRCQLSPSGYSIRWPLLDEDLGIGEMLLPGR
ncbi:MAG: DUF2442 domain-containing protein [Acidobacteria bacterium]|nr:DUF2442 domain-containing protein [Acidobacteriota bacterium]